MKTEKYVCPKCNKPVHVQIDPTSGGIISSPDYDLIADWVFHSKCWMEQLEAGMGGQRTHTERLEARPPISHQEDARQRTEAVAAVARVFAGMTQEQMISCLAAYVFAQADDAVTLASMSGTFGMALGALVAHVAPEAFEIEPQSDLRRM